MTCCDKLTLLTKSGRPCLLGGHVFFDAARADDAVPRAAAPVRCLKGDAAAVYFLWKARDGRLLAGIAVPHDAQSDVFAQTFFGRHDVRGAVAVHVGDPY